ncbi:malto-oligosyltrehalose trehalohydrolase [Aureimonas mangrovi]|uniref:malto-oligosyltrehalose trehalohydrolase n=1 Tax=Aureimonas mangrovi TaxID=2758041 RepID=UPI00163D617B|nr:malto-oligosyltrehalose trehalohydrolase [Aureimonas mangrovi]
MDDTRFAFETCWGTRYDPAGTRFRLWAPHAKGVELIHEGVGSRTQMPMSRSEDGWWEIVTTEVPVNAGYGFRVDNGHVVPDPAARAQLSDVHGLSRLVDPNAHVWRTGDWKGRPWHECVFYELHTGTFSPEGTFDGVVARLDHLKATGITAIELLPVAQFGGRRGWGYDGVLLYCPHEAYGGAEGLKRLVDAAHERGLMVFLDVVYNHFGPDGNYIPSYLPDFFHAEIPTPWGPSIAYDEKPVRDFMIENALYWLEEYRIDGLRLDAIDSIKDTDGGTPFVQELAERVRAHVTDRHVHITTEDDRNIVWHIERGPEGAIPLVSGEWNDDFHHTAHVLATGEQEGYYKDFDPTSAEEMATALASGFVYQGVDSSHRGKKVGHLSAHLPPTAFVNFIQNHDQIGNRAFGDKLRSLASARAHDCLVPILLLSPQIPLMFQGDEFGDCNSFCFFTDFHGELGEAVSKGRKEEFSHFAAFQDSRARAVFPDPNDPATFQTSRIDWTQLARPVNKRRLQVTQELLAARAEHLFPLLEHAPGDCGSALVDGRAFAVAWKLAPGKVWHLFANLSDDPWEIENGLLSPAIAAASEIFANHVHNFAELQKGVVPGYSVCFLMADDYLVEVFKDD